MPLRPEADAPYCSVRTVWLRRPAVKLRVPSATTLR